MVEVLRIEQEILPLNHDMSDWRSGPDRVLPGQRRATLTPEQRRGSLTDWYMESRSRRQTEPSSNTAMFNIYDTPQANVDAEALSWPPWASFTDPEPAALSGIVGQKKASTDSTARASLESAWGDEGTTAAEGTGAIDQSGLAADASTGTVAADSEDSPSPAEEAAADQQDSSVQQAPEAAREEDADETSDEEIILESEGPDEASAKVPDTFLSAGPQAAHRSSLPAALATGRGSVTAAPPAKAVLHRRATTPSCWSPEEAVSGSGILQWRKVTPEAEAGIQDELANAALADKAAQEELEAAKAPTVPAVATPPPKASPTSPRQVNGKQAPKVPLSQPPPKCPPSPKKASPSQHPPPKAASPPSPKLGAALAEAGSPPSPPNTAPASPSTEPRALRGGMKASPGGSRPRSKSPPTKSRTESPARVRQRSPDEAGREARSLEARSQVLLSPTTVEAPAAPHIRKPDLRLQQAQDLSEASEILPWLFFGSNLAASSPEELTTSAGITHVLNLARECVLQDEVRTAVENYNSDRGLRFVYKKYPLGDSGTQDLLDQLPEALNFIDAAHRASPRHHVLVHCARGNSRSTAVMLAYLVQYEGLTLLAAYELLRGRRKIAMPHRPFLGCLGLLECELLGRAVPSLTGGEEWARTVLSEEERAAVHIQALVRGRLARTQAQGHALPGGAAPAAASGSSQRASPLGREALEAPIRPAAKSGARAAAPWNGTPSRTPPSPEVASPGRGAAPAKRSGGVKKGPAPTVTSPVQGRRGIMSGLSPGSSSSGRSPASEARRAQMSTPERLEAIHSGGSGSPDDGDEDGPDSETELTGLQQSGQRHARESSPSRLPHTSSPSRTANAEELPPATRFLASLREKRGTVLRAFILDLDRRGCGRVSSSDLASACRAMGYSKEAKLIWHELRPEGNTSTLRLQDLDAEEAVNVDEFAEVLWAEAGLDLDRAWARIDPGNRMAVTAAEFDRGVRRLGFQGNAALLFRGLDANGLGHLRRRDFDAMERLVPASERLESCDSQGVHELRTWARKMHKAIPMLLAELGLAGGKDTGILEVGDLAARLVSVGYPKPSAATTAAAVASSGGYPGGTHITGSALRAMLAGKPAEPFQVSSALPRPTSPSSAPRASSPRKLWSDSVGSTSLANTKRTCHTRTYFSTSPGSVRWGSPSPPPPRSPAAASAGVTSPGSTSAGGAVAPASPVASEAAPLKEPAPQTAEEKKPAAQVSSWLYCKSGPNGIAADNPRVRPGSMSPERPEKEPLQTLNRASMPCLRSQRDGAGPAPRGLRPQRLSGGTQR